MIISSEASVAHTMPCPNCGATAERHCLTTQALLRTQCESCDYLLITCCQTGRVIESYAPGVCLRSRQVQNGRRTAAETVAIAPVNLGSMNLDPLDLARESCASAPYAISG
ncbi:MAG: hypothetical protein VKJ24_00825 [Synechococcales bacterium]|nr:hypothetical protein [Synechococcales bacterium]